MYILEILGSHLVHHNLVCQIFPVYISNKRISQSFDDRIIIL